MEEEMEVRVGRSISGASHGKGELTEGERR
jgi:hypothetical protein